MMDSRHIFQLENEEQFAELCLKVYDYQRESNPAYGRYVQALGLGPVRDPADIPFLPIRFFKEQTILSGEGEAELVFESSGTTGMQRSRHYVLKAEVYTQSLLRGFTHFFGAPEHWRILALLPGYSTGSSLIHMVKALMKASGEPERFYRADEDQLENDLKQYRNSDRKLLLIGVSHALLKWSERVKSPLPEVTLMETGGMKGHGRELIREELHQLLSERLGVETIASEYGMTELLSQAYSREKGQFRTPPWMRVRIRDPYDPFTYLPAGRSGGINLIDLANVYSCAFVETQDLGKLQDDGSFEVLGRFDHSEIRGCNLLFE